MSSLARDVDVVCERGRGTSIPARRTRAIPNQPLRRCPTRTDDRDACSPYLGSPIIADQPLTPVPRSPPTTRTPERTPVRSPRMRTESRRLAPGPQATRIDRRLDIVGERVDVHQSLRARGQHPLRSRPRPETHVLEYGWRSVLLSNRENADPLHTRRTLNLRHTYNRERAPSIQAAEPNTP